MDRAREAVSVRRDATNVAEWQQAFPERHGYHVAKRVLDLILGSVLVVLCAPLCAIVALLVVLDTPGPAIFGQDRMGYDWRTGRLKPFRFLKFRSMYHNADQSMHREYVKDWINGHTEDGRANGHDKAVHSRHDPRLTPLGRVLRRTSVDELPQLWNVVRGDMSLVGPRPVPLYEVAEYKPRHMARLAATPGITGAWQVMCRGRGTVDEMAQLDIDYIQRQSLWLDLKLLLMTLPAVISGSGAA